MVLKSSEPMIPAPDVEQRLLQACRTIRALPDQDRRFFRLHNSWPDVVQETSEAYGYAYTDAYGHTYAPGARFKPSPADVTDCLVALAWARPLKKKEFKFVWWRSFGEPGHEMSFKTMGDRIHRSDETARRYYREAIDKCWREANGLSTRLCVADVAFVAPRHGQCGN